MALGVTGNYLQKGSRLPHWLYRGQNGARLPWD